LLKLKGTWWRFLSGNIDVVPALKEFARDAGVLVKKKLTRSSGVPTMHPHVAAMLDGLKRFKGDTLFILSEKDFTAQEFQSLVANDKNWKSAISDSCSVLHDVAGADHTFSSVEWQDEVARLTIGWVEQQLSD